MLESTSQYIEQEQIFHGFIPRIMGTRFDVLIAKVGAAKGEKTWSQIVSELQRLEKMLNRFDPTSEVSRLNKNAAIEPFRVSNELWKMLTDCNVYFQKTNGIFDITMRDFSEIIFFPESQSIAFNNPDLSIDFGGYAKGYALEKIRHILENENIENAFVDFGNSSIMGLGKHPYGDSWKVSIENPFARGEVLGEFSLKNTSLTTSGNTPKYSNHIVNPKSGEKVEEKKCVCVLIENACHGEVLSTALIAASEMDKQEIIVNFDAEKVVEYIL